MTLPRYLFVSLSVLALSLLPLNADGCATSNHGSEFDAHLKLEVVDRSSKKYRIVAPLRIGERKILSAWLAYYERPFSGLDQPRLPIYYDEIPLTSRSNEKVGTFKLTKTQPSLYATVRVQYDGFCGAVAEIVVDQSPPESNAE